MTSLNVKKVILFIFVLLISCDVSLLFAAENNLGENELQQQLKQLEKLQQLPASSSATSSIHAVSSASEIKTQQMLAQLSTNPEPPIQPIPNFGESAPPPAPFAQAAQQMGMQLPTPMPVPTPTPELPPSFAPQNQGLQGLAPPPVLPSDQALLGPPPPAPTPPGGLIPGSVGEVSESAFNDMTKSTLPMTPDQIQRLRQLFNASQFAASSMPGTPPRPTATSQYVNLAPGTTPPVIRLSQGFVTSLVFIDSTGAPWPIESYDVGNPTAFNIQWNKTDNILMIQAQSLYTYGNLAVRLRGLVTPVMLTMIPGQKAVDYRVDLRVQGYGPDAKAPTLGDGLPSTANTILLNVLDGVPPDGSRALKLIGGDAQAWLLGDRLYLRTRLPVLSPGWVSTLSSADGMNAYEILKTPMILVSDHGKAVQLRVEGF